MIAAAIVVALVSASSFGLGAPLAARRLPPRKATWMISVGAVASAVSAMLVLALLAFALVGQLPVLADEGRWSSSALRHHALTEPGIEAICLAAVVAAAAALVQAAWRQVAALLASYRACSSMPEGAGELVVLRDGPVRAVAVPGRPGRIVVGQALLASLSARERRVLLAHEHAHLRHGHHWHRSAVAVAAAANPLLAPLRSAIVYTTERWADEEAAIDVGDRGSVATALARVAVITRHPPRSAQLAATAQAVPERVGALLARPSPPRPLLTAAVAGVPLLGALAAAVVWKDTEHLFELAQRIHAAVGAS